MAVGDGVAEAGLPAGVLNIVPGFGEKTGKPLEKNPLKDLRVRQAVNMAMDRKGHIAALAGGAGAITGTFPSVGSIMLAMVKPMEPDTS